MARAEAVTKLPIDQWARIIGLNPLHFNGLYDPNHPTSPCEQPWMQFAWQAADRVSREEVALAIAEAEADIEAHLRYRLLPSWESEEWAATTRPWRPELINVTMTDIRGKRPTLQALWGYFVSGGVRAATQVEAGATITPSDPDNDSFNELCTVTVAVAAGQAPCELHVYFPGYDGNPSFEIRPVNVSITGLVATITFDRVLTVLPDLYDDVEPDVNDSHHRGVAAVDASLLTEVDIYRVYNDPQTQATLMWESTGCGTCSDGTCGSCVFAAETACLMPRSDPRYSVLAYTPATWDADTEEFVSTGSCRTTSPDVTRLFYYAGWQDQSRDCPRVQLDPAWARTIAYFAASKLDRPICECNNIKSWVEHWQRDLAVASRENEAIGQISPEDLNCPLGTRRGGLYAWRQIKAARPIASPVLAPAGGA